ncbi:MAG: WG repeat-containing protein [Bacteroidetes bacterium]|nr:WG repeat-containing protein [Bacteroidota bacterium]
MPKTIVEYKFKKIYNEDKIEIKCCYGKSTNPDKIKDIILNHLKTTFKHEVFPSLAYYGIIRKVELTPITLDGVPFAPGVPFTLGVTTTFYNGYVLKTSNIDSTSKLHKIDDWFIKKKKNINIVNVNGKGYYVSDCSGKDVKEMVFELIPDQKFERRYSGTRYWKDATIPINCAEDNSLTAQRAKRFSAFDKITVTYTNPNGVITDKTIARDSARGYLNFTNDIDKIFKKSEPSPRLIRIIKDGKYGYVDTSGTIIIPIEYENAVSPYAETKFIGVMKNNLVGMVNEKNETVIPFIYESCFRFTHGLAAVKKDGKWGYIDKTGKMVINAVYESVDYFEGTNEFHMAAIVSLNNKYGLINMKGEIVVPIEYDKIEEMNSISYYRLKKGELSGIADAKGNISLSVEYKKVCDFKNGFAPVADQDGKWNFFGTDGNLLAPRNYHEVYDFSEAGKASVILWIDQKSYFGSIDKYGEETWTNPLPTGNSLSSNSNSYTKNTSSTKSKESKTCFILNDLTQAQLGGKNSVKLGFTSFRLATSYIARGKTMEVDCDDVWVYRLVDENSSEYIKSNNLFNTKGKCGQTIKLSDYW